MVSGKGRDHTLSHRSTEFEVIPDLEIIPVDVVHLTVQDMGPKMRPLLNDRGLIPVKHRDDTSDTFDVVNHFQGPGGRILIRNEFPDTIRPEDIVTLDRDGQ